MSRFFPHAPYAEDQPYGRTILTAHVLVRGLTTGAIVGSAVTAARQLVPRNRVTPHLGPRMVLGAARGSLWATPLMMLALMGRMRGREDIEWRDRSWRLLENEGQLETDDWTVTGMVVGPAVWAASGMGRAVPGARSAMGLLGASMLGSVGGTLGYLVWRYGVKGGKFPERQAM